MGKGVEEYIAAKIARSKKYITGKISPVAIITNEAQIAVFQTAPRELPKLNVQIALKTKAYNLEKDRRKKTVLYAELEALQQVRDIIIKSTDKFKQEQDC